MEFLVSPALISNLNVHNFIFLSDRVSQEVYMKNISVAQFLRYSSTLLNQCINSVTLNFGLSRSLILYNVNVWSYVYGKNFRYISS